MEACFEWGVLRTHSLQGFFLGVVEVDYVELLLGQLGFAEGKKCPCDWHLKFKIEVGREREDEEDKTARSS
jgi:hypothetical protein